MISQINNIKNYIMARTINYELKAQKIKGQIDELVTALLEERKNSFDENNKKVKVANVDLEGLSNIELQQLLLRYRNSCKKGQNSSIFRIAKV